MLGRVRNWHEIMTRIIHGLLNERLGGDNIRQFICMAYDKKDGVYLQINNGLNKCELRTIIMDIIRN